jgi:hypothetical protein
LETASSRVVSRLITKGVFKNWNWMLLYYCFFVCFGS